MKKNLKTTTFKTGSAILISMGLLTAFPSLVIAGTMATSISQQSIQVKGTITDSSGEPVIGATIKVKGQTTGTITDLDGHFTLPASKGATLVISYIGYQTQEVIVSSNTMEIKMEEDAESLEEVVVVGYGTMKKKDLTGSIAQVRPDKLANEAPTSVQDVLRGTAGLNVGFSNDAKGGGSMTLRGQRSVYSSGDHNAPLIILDGMQFYGELSEINPNDIEQIDILKDASSAAVYGAKAANGVVLITTKKRQRQQTYH